VLSDPGPRAEPGPIFGFCGRLASRHKGLDLLIAAFGIYKAKGGSGVLWLIGGGSDRESLERQAHEAGFSGSVRFLGEAYGEEKDRRLRAIDVFVHTSRWEGLPMSCLEAAALAKPLLITKETNLGTEVSRSGAGWVLANSSPATIAEALHRCESAAREGELQKRGQLALGMARESFSWSVTAAKLTSLWQARAGVDVEQPSSRNRISLAEPHR
jgi:glycosyltransferase involved in cell wall biosynthesis